MWGGGGGGVPKVGGLRASHYYNHMTGTAGQERGEEVTIARGRREVGRLTAGGGGQRGGGAHCTAPAAGAGDGPADPRAQLQTLCLGAVQIEGRGYAASGSG